MPNVRVLNVDALAGKNRLNPEVLDNVRSGLAVDPARRLKLVANLPYNVATPIIGNLLVHPELRPERIVATIQLELAQRMMAEAEFRRLRRPLRPGPGPDRLRPRPDPPPERLLAQAEGRLGRRSALIPNEAKRASIGDLAWFHSVVRRVFLHRRKNLRRVLYSLWRDRWTDKAEVDALLDGLGLTGQVRAEAMNVEEHIALAVALRRRLGPDVREDDPEPDAEDAREGKDESSRRPPSGDELA